MKTLRILLTCTLLLCGAAAAEAQKPRRPSPVMQEFGHLIRKQERAEQRRAERAAAARASERRAVAPNIPLPVPFASTQAGASGLPSPRALAPVPLQNLVGGHTAGNGRRVGDGRPVARGSARPQSSVRGVNKDRLIVRANPRSWYLGSITPQDRFRVRRVGGPKDRWAYGDVVGNPRLRGVWVLREGLEKGPPAPHTNFTRNREQSRAHLDRRYASWISPGRRDGVNAPLLGRTRMYGNYDPSTGRFYDVLRRLDPNNERVRYRARWVTEDGRAAVIRQYRVNERGKEIKGTSRWGVAPCRFMGIAPCR